MTRRNVRPLTASAQNGRKSALLTLRWPQVMLGPHLGAQAAGDCSPPSALGEGDEAGFGGVGHRPEAGLGGGL